MNELYWITRLDCFNGLLSVLIGIGLLSSIVWLAGKAITSANEGNSWSEDDLKGWNAVMKYLKGASITGIVSMILICFIPSTESALLIYGIGGTIDYLKTSDKAKQLPDKAIIALDKYLENINKEKDEKKEKD